MISPPPAPKTPFFPVFVQKKFSAPTWRKRFITSGRFSTLGYLDPWGVYISKWTCYFSEYQEPVICFLIQKFQTGWSLAVGGVERNFATPCIRFFIPDLKKACLVALSIWRQWPLCATLQRWRWPGLWVLPLDDCMVYRGCSGCTVDYLSNKPASVCIWRRYYRDPFKITHSYSALILNFSSMDIGKAVIQLPMYQWCTRAEISPKKKISDSGPARPAKQYLRPRLVKKIFPKQRARPDPARPATENCWPDPARAHHCYAQEIKLRFVMAITSYTRFKGVRVSLGYPAYWNAQI